jgi:predicted transcriptional regulator
MHYGLAVFLYQRLFRFQTFAIRKQEERERWTLTGAQYTFAVGSEERVEALIAALNRLQESESEPALRLREAAGTLQSQYSEFMEELAYSINDRRLEGRCGLVRFFVFLS